MSGNEGFSGRNRSFNVLIVVLIEVTNLTPYALTRSYSQWRLLIVAPRSGRREPWHGSTALQARAARTGETVFSIYPGAVPTLSFGRNQPASGLYDVGKIRAAGIDVVRRPTGGRAILHHREITYSVTAPVQDAAPLRETYSRITRILPKWAGPARRSRRGSRPFTAAPEDERAWPASRLRGQRELGRMAASSLAAHQWRDDGGAVAARLHPRR